MELHDKEGVEITNKSFSMKKLKESNTTLQYGSFLKSATLLANVGKEEEIEGHLTTNDIEIKPFAVLTDEELLKACGGRTAHKGARHGLNLTGKLQRIAEQERVLLEKMKNKQNKHEVFREPVAKKLKQNPLAKFNSSKDETTSDDNSLPVDTETDYVLKPSRKRKKRDQKQEHQLVTQINGIELQEPEVVEPEEPYNYNGTPVRKKKKAKKQEKLTSIRELNEPEVKLKLKSKQKKGKRKLDEADEGMSEKYLKEKPTKAKKVKLNDSYEASDDEAEDVADKVNAEQELIQKSRKKKKAKKREKKEAAETARILAEAL